MGVGALAAMNHEERRLTIVVADFLRVAAPEGLVWSHFPSGEHRTEKTGGLLKRMGLRRGVPDFLFVLPGGTAAFIELKVATGRLSPFQIDFRESCDLAGAKWAICKTLDEVIATLTGWGVVLKARAA